MAQPPKTPTAPRKPPGGARGLMAGAEAQASKAEELLTGAGEAPPVVGSELQQKVASVARRISSSNARLNNNSTLETMGRMRQDSLLDTPAVAAPGGAIGVSTKDKVLKDVLAQVEKSMVTDIFFGEKKRVDDYVTYDQIHDLVVQVSESIQCYTDNIVSPDDFTKRDISTFYTGPDDEDLDGMQTEVRRKCQDLVRKYSLEDRIESAIQISLVKGDYFICALNLRQELEGLLTEAGEDPEVRERHLFERAVPNLVDPDMMAFAEALRLTGEDGEGVASLNESSLRETIGGYVANLVSFQENTNAMVSKIKKTADSFQGKSIYSGQDIDYAALNRMKGIVTRGAAGTGKKKVSLAGSEIRGSIVKLFPPENVVKLYQDDTLFGYYVIEVTGQTIADFGRNLSGDQSAVVRSLDQNLNVRALGATMGTGPESARDTLINRIIVKTLISRLGNSEFLTKHAEFATDAYAIMQRAKRENKRVTITYVAPDQMVHFRPDGSSGYGLSLLSRVKFIAKLYIGALTNAFMRNSIRRPEKLVFYIDAGSDNDGSNAVQSFIRTVKQSEVKFSNLRDITTTINHIGEFHDYYIPTFNGERPVEVETLNMGPAGEVDNDFLEYLRKAIISGMGVPAAFLGYSEEVAFARSLSMDNGRFLRRTVRLQKHYGQQASQLVRILYENEYYPLEDLVGGGGQPGDPGQAPNGEDDAPQAVSSGSGQARNPHSPPDGADAKALRAQGGPAAGATGATGAQGGADPAEGGATGATGAAPAAAQSEGREADVNFIEVRFPSPATLNMTNTAEAVNAATPIIEFVVATMVPAEDTDPKAATAEIRAEFRKRVAKDALPQLRWDVYEKLLKEAEREGEKLKAKKIPAPGSGLPDVATLGTDGQGQGAGPQHGEQGPGLNNANPGI
jgi:hypothetical protein